MAKYEYWLTPDGLLRVGGWARDGLTELQIAKNMGCSYSTLKDWKKKFPAFSTALKQTKEIADREVENALFKSAKGYDVEEKKIETNEKGETKITTTIRHIPASSTAQIFWLKNRKVLEWRDHPNVDGDAQALDKLDSLLEEFRNAVKQETD